MKKTRIVTTEVVSPVTATTELIGNLPEKKDEWDNVEYPVLGYDSSENVIVLFNEYAEGTVVWVEDNGYNYSMGDYKDNFVMSGFKVLESGIKISLSNTDF